MAIKPGSIIFDPDQNPHMILKVINEQYRLYKTKTLTNNVMNEIRIVRGKAITLKGIWGDGVDNKRLQRKENKLIKMLNKIDKTNNTFYNFRETGLLVLKKYNKRNPKSKYQVSGCVEKSLENYFDFNIENELTSYNADDIITVNRTLNNVIVVKEKYLCVGENRDGYCFSRFDREYFI